MNFLHPWAEIPNLVSTTRCCNVCASCSSLWRNLIPSLSSWNFNRGNRLNIVTFLNASPFLCQLVTFAVLTPGCEWFFVIFLCLTVLCEESSSHFSLVVCTYQTLTFAYLYHIFYVESSKLIGTYLSISRSRCDFFPHFPMDRVISPRYIL